MAQTISIPRGDDFRWPLSASPPLHMRVHRSGNGFNLVEMTIIMSIFGLLAGTIAPRISNRTLAERDARRLSDMQTVCGAIERFQLDRGTYPPADSNGAHGGWDVSHDGNFISALVEHGYLAESATDPVNDDTFHFRYYRYNAKTPESGQTGTYYVLGLRNFESARFAREHECNFEYAGKNWADEFDWVTVGGIPEL